MTKRPIIGREANMTKCRVCDAGPAGQRLHRCPNSHYYVPGSDPGAEYTERPLIGTEER